jgi:hypothetical protein
LIYIYKLLIEENQAQGLGAGLRSFQSGKHYRRLPGVGIWD